jgi:pimeloyl-ACP methyl ester carboxylesterase
MCPVLSAQRLADMVTPAPLPPGSTLVIGFLGGFESWDDGHRSVRQLALRLRERPGVYAESISNHRRKVALELIRRALDTNRNQRLEPEERAAARVILYGQSMGGAAAVATARDLDRLGIPVLLTVQVDSVGLHDGVIPANVRAAVNFYQHDLFTIQGRGKIRAADPSRTRVLGNLGASYLLRSVDETNASWARRVFGGSHAKMELDPVIWNQVEQYISAAIATR